MGVAKGQSGVHPAPNNLKFKKLVKMEMSWSKKLVAGKYLKAFFWNCGSGKNFLGLFLSIGPENIFFTLL